MGGTSSLEEVLGVTHSEGEVEAVPVPAAETKTAA